MEFQGLRDHSVSPAGLWRMQPPCSLCLRSAVMGEGLGIDGRRAGHCRRERGGTVWEATSAHTGISTEERSEGVSIGTSLPWMRAGACRQAWLEPESRVALMVPSPTAVSLALQFFIFILIFCGAQDWIQDLNSPLTYVSCSFIYLRVGASKWCQLILGQLAC